MKQELDVKTPKSGQPTIPHSPKCKENLCKLGKVTFRYGRTEILGHWWKCKCGHIEARID